MAESIIRKRTKVDTSLVQMPTACWIHRSSPFHCPYPIIMLASQIEPILNQYEYKLLSQCSLQMVQKEGNRSDKYGWYLTLIRASSSFLGHNPIRKTSIPPHKDSRPIKEEPHPIKACRTRTQLGTIPKLAKTSSHSWIAFILPGSIRTVLSPALPVLFFSVAIPFYRLATRSNANYLLNPQK